MNNCFVKTTFILFILLITSCSGPRMLTKKGIKFEETNHPKTAFGLYLKALKKKPEYDVAQSGLKRMGIKLITIDIATFTKLVSQKEYRSAVKYYEMAMARKKKIEYYNITIPWSLESYEQYKAAKVIANRQIAEEHYGIAFDFEQNKQYRKAYQSYVTASRADRTLKDVLEKCKIMKDSSTLRITFSFDNKTSTALVEQVARTIYKKNDPFVEIIDWDDPKLKFKLPKISSSNTIDTSYVIERAKAIGVHAVIVIEDITLDMGEDLWNSQDMKLYSITPKIKTDTTSVTDMSITTTSEGKKDTSFTESTTYTHYVYGDAWQVDAIRKKGSRSVDARAYFQIIDGETGETIRSTSSWHREESTVDYVDCNVDDRKSMSSKIPPQKKISLSKAKSEKKKYRKRFRLPFSSNLFTANRFLTGKNRLKSNAIQNLGSNMGKDIYRSLPQR